MIRLTATLAAHDHERSRPLVEAALRLSSSPMARARVRSLALEYAAQVHDWRFVDEFGDETLVQSRQSGKPSAPSWTSSAHGRWV